MSKGLLVDVPPSDDDEVHVIDLNVPKQQLKLGHKNKAASNNLVPMSLEVIDCLASSATRISKTKESIRQPTYARIALWTNIVTLRL